MKKIVILIISYFLIVFSSVSIYAQDKKGTFIVRKSGKDCNPKYNVTPDTLKKYISIMIMLDTIKKYTSIYDFIGYGGKDCKIISYDIVFVPTGKDLFLIRQNQDNFLFKAVKFKAGDRIVFENIRLKGKDDIFKVDDVVYTIK